MTIIHILYFLIIIYVYIYIYTLFSPQALRKMNPNFDEWICFAMGFRPKKPSNNDQQQLVACRVPAMELRMVKPSCRVKQRFGFFSGKNGWKLVILTQLLGGFKFEAPGIPKKNPFKGKSMIIIPKCAEWDWKIFAIFYMNGFNLMGSMYRKIFQSHSAHFRIWYPKDSMLGGDWFATFGTPHLTGPTLFFRHSSFTRRSCERSPF